MSDLMLDVGQAAELKEAFRRGDWTNQEIKKLCEGNLLQQVRNVLHGRAEIQLIKRLVRFATTNLPARSEPFVSTDYFQDRKGLRVWRGFKDRVVSTTQTVQDVSAMSVESFDLVFDSTDTQIRAELPENHVFQDASIFCSHLAGMIDLQAEGTEGPLLTNGYANIFYVNVGDRVVTVRMFWFADCRQWVVYAAALGDRTWFAGGRVFSAAAVA